MGTAVDDVRSHWGNHRSNARMRRGTHPHETGEGAWRARRAALIVPGTFSAPPPKRHTPLEMVRATPRNGRPEGRRASSKQLARPLTALEALQASLVELRGQARQPVDGDVAVEDLAHHRKRARDPPHRSCLAIADDPSSRARPSSRTTMPVIGRKAKSTGARLVRERTKADSKQLERFNNKTAAQGTDARLGTRDAGCVIRPFKAVARIQIPLGPPKESRQRREV